MGMMKRQRSKPSRKGCNYISRRTFDYVSGMESSNTFFFSNLGEVGRYPSNTGKCSCSSGSGGERSVDSLKRVVE